MVSKNKIESVSLDIANHWKDNNILTEVNPQCGTFVGFDWVEYEGIQSDIFDHIFAVLPKFGLRAFQGGTVEAAASRGLSINEPEI